MKKKSLVLGLAVVVAGFMALGAPGVAKADTLLTGPFLTGTFNFNIYTGTGVTNSAVFGAPNNYTQSASFTYTGPLNFYNLNGQNYSNTFGEFFSTATTNEEGFETAIGNSITVDGVASTSGDFETMVDTFLARTMSTATGLTSYISITGQTWGATFTVHHDDGASLYNTNSSYTATTGTAFSDPQGWQVTSSGSLNSGPFELDYVEYNGSPSELQVEATPEPTSLFLVVGVLLAWAVVYRKRLMA